MSEFTLDDLEKYFQELVEQSEETHKRRTAMYEERNRIIIGNIQRYCKEKGITEAEFWGFKNK